jgi:hypothetical protein
MSKSHRIATERAPARPVDATSPSQADFYDLMGLLRAGWTPRFFGANQNEIKLSALLREFTWTHDLPIPSGCKCAFFPRCRISERGDKRDLNRRQVRPLFEQAVESPARREILTARKKPDDLDLAITVNCRIVCNRSLVEKGPDIRVASVGESRTPAKVPS